MKRYIFKVTPYDPKTIEVEADSPDDAYEMATDWCQLKGDETNLYWKILDQFTAWPQDKADYKATDLFEQHNLRRE